MQLSFFEDETRQQRLEDRDIAVDGIRRRFGYHSIGMALTRKDDKLGKLDAKSDNTIGPVGYFNGSA